MNTTTINTCQLDGPQPGASFYLPYEFSSVAITPGNVNPFSIDPEQTVAITAGNVNPFDVDPEQTSLIATGNVNPFDVDPEQTSVITAGNTDPFGIDPEQTVSFFLDSIPPEFLLESWYPLLLESGVSLRLEQGPVFDIDPDLTTLITTGLTSSD